MVKDFLVRAQRRRRPDKKPTVSNAQPGDQSHSEVESLGDEPALNTVVEDKPSYIDLERAETADPTTAEETSKSLNDTLKPGGHFVCKFYQGAEDKELEKQLRKLFAKVFRDKPESSRKDSKEGYFVGLNRKATVHLGDSSDEPRT
ncbi:hypothetical protein ACHAQF_001129 [Verticillium nonalfalfae]